MRYLKKYILYTEGLFNDNESDDEVVKDVLRTLERSQDYTPEFVGDEIIVKNIKLDSNPGVYNIFSKMDSLILKYYKFPVHKDIMSDGVLVFTKELECSPYLCNRIFSILKKTNKFEDKSNYEVYHLSYTDAINTALAYAESLGYTYDKDETAVKIGMGPKKPSEGVTNIFSIILFKDGKEQKKQLHIQVYGMKVKYELNCYIN